MAKILIIDDDPDNREVLRYRLEAGGHQVIEAKDGEEGIVVAKSQVPALIFVDGMIPKMDGWQVCRHLKSQNETKEIPIIMLTARSQQIDELRGYESGVSEYITKPWDPEKLIKAVEQCLSKAPKRA